MTGLHRAAEVGFARAARAYERGRPGYPAKALTWLKQRLDPRAGRTVLDLAAGTGALTRGAIGHGGRGHRRGAGCRNAPALPAQARVLEGTAEAIPLDDGTTDAVTVAQAFHWFDGPRALREIHRVLRSGARWRWSGTAA